MRGSRMPVAIARTAYRQGMTQTADRSRARRHLVDMKVRVPRADDGSTSSSGTRFAHTARVLPRTPGCQGANRLATASASAHASAAAHAAAAETTTAATKAAAATETTARAIAAGAHPARAREVAGALRPVEAGAAIAIQLIQRAGVRGAIPRLRAQPSARANRALGIAPATAAVLLPGAAL